MYKLKKFELIENYFDKNINAHSYLFYTNDFLSCKNDVETLIKKIFKNDKLNSLENDFVCINRSEKKIIQKEDILNIKKLIYNTSYINTKRVYLIEEAEKLNSSSANMILKFLEEPADNIIGFFITNNIDLVLSTIKSRCQIVNMFYEKEEFFEEEKVSIIENILKKNINISIFESKNLLKKYDRNQIIQLFENYLKYLISREFNDSNYTLIKKINKVLNLLNNNVNVDYALDVLFLEGD